MAAISQFVAERVNTYWRRDASVIAPPVRVDAFNPGAMREDFYLWVGELVPYKRPDLVVAAFRGFPRRLIVAGGGPLLHGLQKEAADNVQFLGRVDDGTVVSLLSKCRALVFPGVEDFGIVPVEANAAGAPVIAFGKGGVLDTIEEGVSGLFFNEQTPAGLQAAIEEFEAREAAFDPIRISEVAQKFSEERFHKEFSELVESVL